MHTILRGPGIVRVMVGLTSLAILGSVMLTALGLLLLSRAIEVEILLITAVVVAMVVPLLILVFFKLNRERGGRRLAIKGLWSRALNCRHLLQQAETTLVQAKRGSTTFSLLLLEIDNLKEIKETYGLSAAERVLQALAQACLEIVRSSDVVARCSDEKFMMFLPEARTEEALIIAHRIRHVLSQVPVVIGNALINFTVSIGVAAYDENTVTLDCLLRRAGRALYNAKRHGSNRVEVG